MSKSQAPPSNERPICEDKQKVTLACCDHCGTVKAFTFTMTGYGFPDSGYWMKCVPCDTYRMFFRFHDGHIVREEPNKDIYNRGFNAGLKTAAETVRGNDSISSSRGGSDKVANVILSNRRSP
jgi:hypothetical protein